MAVRGLGQSPDSAVTGTAAWLSSVCAILSKDATFGPILNDPYALAFAEAISPEAPALLARFDDEAYRSAFIAERESAVAGGFSVVCYRKPEMERMAREALAATGARQLVIMGVGCDTLALRLARSGLKPAVYEIDRPAVSAFRTQVMAGLDVDTSHIRGVGVDFDKEAFGDVLIRNGYDPNARTIFFAEGLLGYLLPEAVDDIFSFIRTRSAPGSRFVFSFTERRRRDAVNRTPSSLELDLQGETPQFDLPPAEAKAFVEARGLRLMELLTASDLKQVYGARYGGKVGVIDFMHLAVAETGEPTRQ